MIGSFMAAYAREQQGVLLWVEESLGVDESVGKDGTSCTLDAASRGGGGGGGSAEARPVTSGCRCCHLRSILVSGWRWNRYPRSLVRYPRVIPRLENCGWGGWHALKVGLWLNMPSLTGHPVSDMESVRGTVVLAIE